MLYQPPIPPKYNEAAAADLREWIARRKAEFGNRLVILGHHYQEDEVIAFADHTGDSLKLSQIAAEQTDAAFVVFCGVHFMAETADMLTDDSVKVILPDMSAGCSMADMAAIDQLEVAWEDLTAATDDKIIPITYVNSAASIKAFCGRNDGACCTSSNAAGVLEWALGHGEKVLFLPDQHLGRNTALAMGWPHESMVVYDPNQPNGGLTPAQIAGAKFILWAGHCSVHKLFSPADCDAIRALGDDWKIIVHPECTWEVVERSDFSGSTEAIIRTIREAPAATKWAVGTEIHLINRLAVQFAPEKTVRSLAGIQCLCTTMYRIDLPHLAFVLDELAAGRVINQVTVDAETRKHALVALDRMLALKNKTPAAQPV